MNGRNGLSGNQYQAGWGPSVLHPLFRYNWNRDEFAF